MSVSDAQRFVNRYTSNKTLPQEWAIKISAVVSIHENSRFRITHI
jgi:hypothetical protein